MSKLFFGGIEAGGTKFCLAIGDAHGNIVKRTIIPTRNSNETLLEVISFFKNAENEFPLTAIGIGSFGPVDLDPKSETYGYITSPPKLAWTNFNFVGAIKKNFNLPIGFDTDVNSAALGEYKFGAAKNIDTFLYITVGTGIGVGGMIAKKLLHGLTHPEMGHIFIPHDYKIDPFEGICPFHKDCLEGLASGPAIMKRWNITNAGNLPDNHPGWKLEAEYLAYALSNYILTFSPLRIIIGGGVMHQVKLLPNICLRVQQILNGYIKHISLLQNINQYIVTPALGDDAGICGAIALGVQTYENSL